MITEPMRYCGLLASLICAVGCQSPDLSDYTYTDYGFERAYYEEIKRIEKSPQEEVKGELAEMRSALGPMVCMLAMMASVEGENGLATSEENIEKLTYDVFTGDVLCWRNVKQTHGVVEDRVRETVLARARSLCRAYPIGERFTRHELFSMTLFLGNCYFVVGDALPTAFSVDLDHDTEREQYPFLVTMAACGDKNAKKRISNKAKDDEELYHLVKIFSASAGIKADNILDGKESERKR